MNPYTTRDFQILFALDDTDRQMALIETRARVRHGHIHDRLADDEYLRWFSPRQLMFYQYLRWARDRGLT